jgi:DNA-binding NarL/FixJ family response regulator
MSTRVDAPPAVLTDAQAEVLLGYAQGHDTPGVARQTQVSVHTVRDHLKNAVARLGAANGTQAVYIATSLQLIPAATQGASNARLR